MNISHNQPNQEDEIDLGILLLKITKSISKYKFSIILFSLIGIGLGVSAYYVQKPKYESNMIIQSSILTKAYAESLSQNLYLLVEEDNYSLLAEKLSMTAAQVSEITKMYIMTIAEKVYKKENGEEVLNNLFKISVETTENTILPVLQAGILTHIENNAYVKKQLHTKKHTLNALINKLNVELLVIDSMKNNLDNTVNYNTKNKNNIVIFDPTNVHSRSLNFYRQKIRYEQELALMNGVQLVDGFTSFKKPASPKLLKSIVVGFAIGLFFAFGIVVFLELRSYLRKIDTETSSN